MKTKKYIVSSFKYFLKLLVLVALIYVLLFLVGGARVTASELLHELLGSWRGWAMFVALAAIAAVYPTYGFVRREVDIPLTPSRELIIEAFDASGFALVAEEEGQSLTFRAYSLAKRMWLMFDDRITVTAHAGGIVLEGVRKEVVQTQFRIETYRHREDNLNNDQP